jgi:hypothetical protein
MGYTAPCSAAERGWSGPPIDGKASAAKNAAVPSGGSKTQGSEEARIYAATKNGTRDGRNQVEAGSAITARHRLKVIPGAR